MAGRKRKPNSDESSVEEEKKSKGKAARKSDGESPAKESCSKSTGNPLNGSPADTGMKYPGAHVSAAGGVFNSVENALKIGASSFAMFLKNQRTWNFKPLEQEVADQFVAAREKSGIAPHLILPHGPYLMNLGSPNENTRAKSRKSFVDDLHRCDSLGILLYNIHPGSTLGEISREKCIAAIAQEINAGLKQTKTVRVVLENMCKQGHTIGGDFAELKAIIDLVDDKSRIGVCIDTCHAMAADGFDNMKAEFGDKVGFKYLVAMHINDSKGECGCHLDRHENLGQGKIGLDGFRRIMNDPLFNDIPLILETPYSDNTYQKEIKLLRSLVQK